MAVQGARVAKAHRQRSAPGPGGGAGSKTSPTLVAPGAERQGAAEGRVGADDLRGLLYDATGADREIVVTRQAIARLNDRRILWIDLPRREAGELERLAALLRLDRRTVAGLKRPRVGPRIDNYGAYLQFAVVAAPGPASRDPKAPRTEEEGDGGVDFLVGRNWVVTIHGGEAAYLRAFRAQDKGDTGTGALSAAALSASLLDWHLGEYFAEVSRIECEIDDLDERILAEPSEEKLLAEILAIRRRSARLRRTLMAQRTVFYGFGRPDLGNGGDKDAAAAFTTLAARFERAVDEVEHTRDLSLGSFELFTSRSSQQTNDLVKALTFFTVIIGTTAAVAGLFGMNFDPPFFNSGSIGFFAVTLGLLLVGSAAWIVGRRRRWI